MLRGGQIEKLEENQRLLGLKYRSLEGIVTTWPLSETKRDFQGIGPSFVFAR